MTYSRARKITQTAAQTKFSHTQLRYFPFREFAKEEITPNSNSNLTRTHTHTHMRSECFLHYNKAVCQENIYSPQQPKPNICIKNVSLYKINNLKYKCLMEGYYQNQQLKPNLAIHICSQNGYFNTERTLKYKCLPGKEFKQTSNSNQT